ncbi:hypothetical protein [Elstera sp.]|uniref:hypothetical protein n=1 Tax=Elstera sp. TaxID=1916664 RepID=UPI0037C0EAD5
MLHALAWFWIGYSDGLVYLLISLTEITGYIVYIAPVIAAYVLYLVVFRKTYISFSIFLKQLLFFGFSAILLFFQFFTVGEIYIAGYSQIMVMIALILFIADFFKTNEAVLRPKFDQAILTIHYVICVYALAAWFVRWATTVDISLFISDIDSLTGFAANRTSGLHREPSWAGYALASSYLGVLITRPHRMLVPQILYLLAIAATGAGVGLVLASFFIAHQVLISKRGNLLTRLGFLGGLALLLLFVFSGRISDVLNQRDPSSEMRLESTIVAAEVITETFPVGTGFGNYQDYAVFDPNIWNRLIDISEATYYKSDILILNFIAELGFFGILLSLIFVSNFTSRSNLLVFLVVIVMLLTSGTVIQPTYFVLAAIIGLERGRAARQAMIGPRTPR